MQSVKLLFVFICVLSVCSLAAAQECINGISCYPSDCCGQYKQCVGSTFYPAQQTAPGTVCKAGKLVFASECTTPCSSSSSTPATQAPATQAPTVKATVPPPTQATSKPIKATEAPTQAATQAPTKAPTQAATQAPTQAPTQAAKPTVKATIAPTNAPTRPPTNGGCNLADVFTEADYNFLFPHANGAYLAGLPNQHAIFNYSYLIDAAKRFPTFACEGDVATRKREVAAFLAHTSQETSGWWAGQIYNWGFYFSTEVGCTNPTCTMYCQNDAAYPCAAGKGYFGRGPIQLSWNYNYGQVSKYLYGNDVLLQNPDMMFDERGTAFTTAIWFWMTPQGPKPSCHDVMVGAWTPSASDITAGRKAGFGMTTNIINGGLECNTGITIPKVVNRIGYYSTYAARLGVSIGENVECNKMRSF